MTIHETNLYQIRVLGTPYSYVKCFPLGELLEYVSDPDHGTYHWVNSATPHSKRRRRRYDILFKERKA